jgi:four helix bundle protein
MELEKLEVYQISMELGEKIWEIVKPWPFFEKETLGKQLVRAVDSVSANISEGYGRFHFNDSKNFLFFARGSLYETKTWLLKARSRNLISQENYEALLQQSTRLAIKLNNYIKAIGKSS